jgi:cobalt-zinc-cadmium efflux system membrane fusion protein
MKMKKILIFIVALIVVSCGNTNNKPADEAVTSMPVETAETIDIKADAITSATRTNNQPIFNGVLVIPPQYHATVTLFMDGVVKSTSLLSGTFVRRGELLAILENPEYITLQQSYIESHAQEEFLEIEFRRQETLANSDATSQKRLQESKAEYLSMKSRREAAAAQLKLLGFEPAQIPANGIISQLELRAPIAGYIANVQINTGAHVAAGSTVCNILDKSKMLLKLTIFERDINRINVGDDLIFRANGMGAQEFSAKVISLGQTVGNESRSLEAYATVIDNNPQFRPGMYINAQVVYTEKED